MTTFSQAGDPGCEHAISLVASLFGTSVSCGLLLSKQWACLMALIQLEWCTTAVSLRWAGAMCFLATLCVGIVWSSSVGGRTCDGGSPVGWYPAGFTTPSLDEAFGMSASLASSEAVLSLCARSVL